MRTVSDAVTLTVLAYANGVVAYAYTHRFLGVVSSYPNGFSIRLQFHKAVDFEMSIG